MRMPGSGICAGFTAKFMRQPHMRSLCELDRTEAAFWDVDGFGHGLLVGITADGVVVVGYQAAKESLEGNDVLPCFALFDPIHVEWLSAALARAAEKVRADEDRPVPFVAKEA